MKSTNTELHVLWKKKNLTNLSSVQLSNFYCKVRQAEEKPMKNSTDTNRDEVRNETFQRLKSFTLKCADDTAGIKPLSLKLQLVNISWRPLSSEATKLIQWLHWDLRAHSFLTYRLFRGPAPFESCWSSVNTRESSSGRPSNAMLVANKSRTILCRTAPGKLIQP